MPVCNYTASKSWMEKSNLLITSLPVSSHIHSNKLVVAKKTKPSMGQTVAMLSSYLPTHSKLSLSNPMIWLRSQQLVTFNRSEGKSQVHKVLEGKFKKASSFTNLEEEGRKSVMIQMYFR